jgi:uncharacterized protein
VELLLRPNLLSVCRLAPDAPWPQPPDNGSLFSATSSGASSAVSADTERSLVCRQDLAPSGSRIESGWRALTAAGPLDFDLVGVLADLTTPLARSGVSVFVLSTFDTDHLLVRDEDVDWTVDALAAAGHLVSRA